jgi:baseplate J-like protein
MPTINLKDNRQVIDYLARDYASFRKALIDLIPAKLPEWTDRSEADFGIVLIELFAYMADILSYYQDRIANEAFLSTAQERRSVIQHLRLIGYEMAPAAPASARLNIVVANNINDTIVIRTGDQFSTASTPDRKSVLFEYTDTKPLIIDLTAPTVIPALKPDGTPDLNFKMVVDAIPVKEGRSIVNDVIGVSDGTPNQRFLLAQPGVLRGTLLVSPQTSPPSAPWNLRQTLAFSRAADPDFTTETDENDVTTVLFGDGQYGQIPPASTALLASYRTGGGPSGNVGIGQISSINNSPQLQLLGAKVFNRLPASGGAERESIDQAVKFAPTVFTSMQRAVTAQDYVAQAKLFPGVSKARAAAKNWNEIQLFIAPTGSGELPNDILKRDLLAYFEDKRMLTTSISIEKPNYVNIIVAVDVTVRSVFRTDDVLADAKATMAALFDFNAVDFGQSLYLGDTYQALEARPGVDHVFVSRFARFDDPSPIAKDGRIVLLANEIPVLREPDLVITGSGGI